MTMIWHELGPSCLHRCFGSSHSAHRRCRHRSEVAREALPEGCSQWALERCTVSEDGRPASCSGQLQVCRRKGKVSDVPTM